MDIAALSVQMASQNAAANASIAATSIVKGQMEQEGANLVKMLESSAAETMMHPGSTVDFKL